jgi:parallel beta-helix repeat protein
MTGRRIRGGMLTVLAAILIPAAAGEAAGTTLYVDGSNPGCSDNGSGSPTRPFCRIGAAASKVTAGETVQVATGTYPEDVTPPTSGTSVAPIVFTAAPGARVTLTSQPNGFSIVNRSWIVVKGFTVTGTSDYGITISGSSNITISGNDVSSAGQRVSGRTRAGIRLSNVTDSLIAGNTSHDNSDYGILVNGGSTRVVVRGNETYGNAQGFQRAAAGIRVYQAVGNSVIGNVTHDNEDSGIECYPGANNTLVAGNVSYDNGDHGIDNLTAAGQRIVGNTVFNNVTAGINLEGSSTGGTVANNISVDNGIDSPRTHSDIRVDSTSTSGATMNNDLVQLTTADALLIWDSKSYSTLDAFKAATGQESRGIQADPKWASRAQRDFHLTAGSRAIDSADSGVSGEQGTDIEGAARHDDPGTPNTGTGPRAYDDRGAYEFGGTSPPPPDEPPAAALTVTPASGTAPLDVTADASGSTDGDATPIATYSFDFGDGTAAVGPQAGATATHTYAAVGSYAVTVTVTDTAGNASTATAQVTATTAGGPTNLVGNPGFETSLTGWNVSGSGAGVTLTRVAGGHTGSWEARVDNPTSAAASCTLNDSPNWVPTTVGGTYTAELWVRAPSAGATLKLRLREYDGSTLVGTTTTLATLTTSWQKVSVTATVAVPGSTLDFNAYISSAAPGTCFSADDASIVAGA